MPLNEAIKNISAETEPRVTSLSLLVGASASAMFSSPTYTRSTNIALDALLEDPKFDMR